MTRRYSAQYNGVAVTAQQDLFELNAPATAAVRVLGVVLAQSTEVGDAQEEGLSILFKRGATTSGSGGTVPTAAQLFASAAFAGTVEANNTTKATGGTIVTLHADVWNVRTQFLWIPTPEMQIVLAPSDRFTVELATTPADSITMNGTLYFEAVS